MINVVSRLESFSEGEQDVNREIKRALRLHSAGNNVVVAFTVQFAPKPGGSPPERHNQSPLTRRQFAKPLPEGGKEVGLFRDKGIQPALFQRDIIKYGSLEEALRHRVQQRTGELPTEPIVSIEMHLFPSS